MTLVNFIKRSVFSIPKKIMNLVNAKFFYKYQHLAYQMAFEKEVQDWNPDIVQCNDWQTLSLGCSIKQTNDATLIFDSHELETHRNPPLSRSRKRWMTRYQDNYLPECDLVTTVCDSIATYIAKKHSIKKPLVVVNSPIFNKDHAIKPAKRWGRISNASDVRSETSFEPDSFIMVVVGNATVNRGIETILSAMCQLPDEIKLAIVGKSTDLFRSKLQTIIQAHCLENRVEMVEPINPTKVVPFISSADIGIIPLIPMVLSYELALPNKLFECAFAGLPIIASDTYEIKKNIDKYDLGTTYPANNSNALAQCIQLQFEKWQQDKSLKQDNTAFIEEMRFEKSIEKVFDWIETNQA